MSSFDDKKKLLYGLICLELRKRENMFAALSQSAVTITHLCSAGDISASSEELVQLQAFAEQEYGMEIDPMEIEEILSDGNALLAEYSTEILGTSPSKLN